MKDAWIEYIEARLDLARRESDRAAIADDDYGMLHAMTEIFYCNTELCRVAREEL